jgi:hypothetical protein
MTNGRDGRSDVTAMAESQLAELHNVRVLLEEARVLSRKLAHHLRALLESRIGEALAGLDQQIGGCEPPGARAVPSQPTPHQRVHHEDHRQGHGPPQHRQQEERHSASHPFRRFWVSR